MIDSLKTAFKRAVINCSEFFNSPMVTKIVKLVFEIVLSVVERDVFNDGAKPFDVSWYFTILNPVSDYIAEYASEIFVS